jgi:hypothetical protein
MNTQHTPGPWEARTDAHGRGLIYAEGNWLASTWRANGNGNNAPHLPSKANARLIAAAPDLLEALQLCEGNIASLLWSAHPKVYGMWLDVVRAAIDKAIGEKA